MSGKFYGRDVFDARLIIAQIVFLQSIFYISQGVVLLFLSFVTESTEISLWEALASTSMTIQYIEGWVPILTAFITAPIISTLVFIIVRRAKQCLDYCATIYLIHFLACWLFEGLFPVNPAWWFVNIACMAISTVLSEFMCARQEMSSISLSI